MEYWIETQNFHTVKIKCYNSHSITIQDDENIGYHGICDIIAESMDRMSIISMLKTDFEICFNTYRSIEKIMENGYELI